jgi:hypothetical protein
MVRASSVPGFRMAMPRARAWRDKAIHTPGRVLLEVAWSARYMRVAVQVCRETASRPALRTLAGTYRAGASLAARRTQMMRAAAQRMWWAAVPRGAVWRSEIAPAALALGARTA